MAESLPSWLTDARTIGGAAAFRAAAEFLANPIRAAERYTARHGEAICFLTQVARRRGRTRVLLLGPRYNREILTATDLLRPSGSIGLVGGPPGSAQAELRTNYLASHGAEHTALARTMLPHLARSRLASQFGAMRDLVAAAVAGWPVDRTVDLHVLVRDLSLTIALTLLFDRNRPDRVRSFGKLLVDHYEANSRPIARLRIPALGYGRVLQLARELEEFVTEWVAEARGCPPDQDLRAALAAHRRPNGELLCPARLAAHVHLVGLASYETIASAATWVLFLLALHPAVLADLVDEIGGAPPVETIDQDRLAALPLLDAVIKESMRVVTPAPFLPLRPILRRDPTGRLPSMIVVSPHLTHRVPEVFPEARRFQPERWSRIEPTAYQYLPFSAGPRRCPGAAFATEFIRLVVAAFMPRFRLDARPGVRLDRLVRTITTPKPGIPMRLVPQDHRFIALAARGNIHDLVDLAPAPARVAGRTT
jgi:cytochrome P450